MIKLFLKIIVAVDLRKEKTILMTTFALKVTVAETLQSLARSLIYISTQKETSLFSASLLCVIL